MVRRPSKPRLNGIRAPSGDQAGSSLFSVSGVTARSSRPPRRTIPICTAPAVTSEKAIRDPSGEHEGYSAGDLDTREGRAPSAAIVQSSSAPERVDANAIVLPSGDHAGDQ